MIGVCVPPWPTLWFPILFILVVFPKLFDTIPYLRRNKDVDHAIL